MFKICTSEVGVIFKNKTHTCRKADHLPGNRENFYCYDKCYITASTFAASSRSESNCVQLFKTEIAFSRTGRANINIS